MTEKHVSSSNGKSVEKLDEIRDIIAGPRLRQLEVKIQKLSRQIEQLAEQNEIQRVSLEETFEQMNGEFAERMQGYVRRAASHRARTTRRITALAVAMAALTDQMRAISSSKETKRTTTGSRRKRKKKLTTGIKISIKKRQEIFGKEVRNKLQRASARKRK